MSSLCTANRSSASLSGKNSCDFHCRRYQAGTSQGVPNSPQWSEVIVHRSDASFKGRHSTMYGRMLNGGPTSRPGPPRDDVPNPEPLIDACSTSLTYQCLQLHRQT